MHGTPRRSGKPAKEVRGCLISAGLPAAGKGIIFGFSVTPNAAFFPLIRQVLPYGDAPQPFLSIQFCPLTSAVSEFPKNLIVSFLSCFKGRYRSIPALIFRYSISSVCGNALPCLIATGVQFVPRLRWSPEVCSGCLTINSPHSNKPRPPIHSFRPYICLRADQCTSRCLIDAPACRI